MKRLLFIVCFLFISVSINAEEFFVLDNYSEEKNYSSAETKKIALKTDNNSEISKATINTEKISAVAKIKSKLSKDSNVSEQKPWKLQKAEGPSISVLGGNMLKGLALCLGMVFIALSILKRFKFAKTNIPRACKVLETLKLTDKSKLLLIEVEGKKIAISVGSERVSAIHEFKNEDSKLKIQNKAESNIINEQGLDLLCQ